MLLHQILNTKSLFSYLIDLIIPFINYKIPIFITIIKKKY